jgi:hypothetical protein
LVTMSNVSMIKPHYNHTPIIAFTKKVTSMVYFKCEKVAITIWQHNTWKQTIKIASFSKSLPPTPSLLGSCYEPEHSCRSLHLGMIAWLEEGQLPLLAVVALIQESTVSKGLQSKGCVVPVFPQTGSNSATSANTAPLPHSTCNGGHWWDGIRI